MDSQGQDVDEAMYMNDMNDDVDGMDGLMVDAIHGHIDMDGEDEEEYFDEEGDHSEHELDLQH